MSEDNEEVYFKDSDYMLDISVYRKSDSDNLLRTGLKFTSSINAVNVFFEIFEFIRSEALKYLRVENLNSSIEKVAKILFQRFDYDLDESVILAYINNMKKKEYPLSISDISDLLLSLREERIRFWEWILEKYKKDKNRITALLKDRYTKQETLDKKYSEEIKNITREDIESLMPKCPECKTTKYRIYELVYHRCLECRNSVILNEGLSSNMIKKILDQLNSYSDKLKELEFDEFYTENDFKRFKKMGKTPILNYEMTKEFKRWLQEEHHTVYKGQSVKCPKCNSLNCVRFVLKCKHCQKCSYAKLFRV